LAQLRKSSNEAVTTLLAYEVFDPKNTSPCVKYCHLSLYLHLLRCKYYIVDIVVFPFFFPCDLGVIIPIGRGGLCKTFKEALTTT
jgi:hypothetical protein